MLQRRRQWHPTNQKSSLDRRSFVVVPITISPTGRGGPNNEVRKYDHGMKMCWIDVTGRLGCLVAASSPLFRGVGGHNWEGWLSRFAEVVKKPPTSRLITVRLWRPRWSNNDVNHIKISPRRNHGLASRFHATSAGRLVSRSYVPDHHGWVGLGPRKPEEHIFRWSRFFVPSSVFLAHSTESFTFHPHSQSPPLTTPFLPLTSTIYLLRY